MSINLKLIKGGVYSVYTCIIYFNNENRSKLSDLINSDIARLVDFQTDCVFLSTRKIWKLYWFNFRYRKFQKKFSYSEVFDPYRSLVVSDFITNNYSYDLEPLDGYTKLLTVYFENIKDILEIKRNLFL